MTDDELIEILTKAQEVRNQQRAAAGQYVGRAAPLVWGYAGLAAVAKESEGTARSRARRLVAEGKLRRLCGRQATFALAVKR